MKIINVCNNCQIVEANGREIVFSYDTPVLSILDHGNNGNMEHSRLWSGWSVTTQRHINKALDLYGLSHINKAQWDKMPVETINI